MCRRVVSVAQLCLWLCARQQRPCRLMRCADLRRRLSGYPLPALEVSQLMHTYPRRSARLSLLRMVDCRSNYRQFGISWATRHLHWRRRFFTVMSITRQRPCQKAGLSGEKPICNSVRSVLLCRMHLHSEYSKSLGLTLAQNLSHQNGIVSGRICSEKGD